MGESKIASSTTLSDINNTFRLQPNQREIFYQFNYLSEIKKVIPETTIKLESCKSPYSHNSCDGRIINVDHSNYNEIIEGIIECKKASEFKTPDLCVKACFAQAMMYNWMDKNYDCEYVYVGTDKFFARIYIDAKLRASLFNLYHQAYQDKYRPSSIYKCDYIMALCANLKYDIWYLGNDFNLKDIVIETVEHFM